MGNKPLSHICTYISDINRQNFIIYTQVTLINNCVVNKLSLIHLLQFMNISSFQK